MSARKRSVARELGWKRLVVATDFSRPAGAALRSAEGLARDLGAAIVLVHVVEMPPASYAFGADTLVPDVRGTWVEEARRTLAAHARRSSELGGASVTPVVRIGKPWVEILEVAREQRADAICLGNSGHSRFDRLLLGSTAENVVRRSPIPVLVTRAGALRGVRRVLLPVDFQEAARPGLDAGSRAAIAFALERLPRTAELEALHVVPPVKGWTPIVPPTRDDVTQRVQAQIDRFAHGRVRARVVLDADPAATILSRARSWRADLVVLSTHGRRGARRAVMGSVAEKVARYADRPVLVLPPPARR